MKKILFFTPSCRRTGSEIVLYNLISNIDNKHFQPVGVVSSVKGELLSQFVPNIVTFSVADDYHRILSPIELLKIKLFKQNFYKKLFTKIHQLLKPDIWYINTIVQPEILLTAQSLGIPCVVHSHELETMLMNLTTDYIKILNSYPQLIIACSQTAKEVIKRLGYSRNIEVFYPTINPKILEKYTHPDAKTKFREKYLLPDNAFIWLMSGSIDPNKNPMRFIRLAQNILQHHPQTYFLWLGSDSTSAMSYYLTNYCQELGIAEQIRWVDNLEQNSYYEYFVTADGFVLTSNRESFSLVVLEAMDLGKPVVCFNCGGPKEILSKETGIIIDSFDENDMIESMLMIMNCQFNYSPFLAKEQSKQFSLQNTSELWNSILVNYFT